MSFAATQMDSEISKLSEVNQKQKNKYYIISLIISHMWNRNDTNEPIH